MNRKATYESPTCICVEMSHQQNLLLQTSGTQSIINVYADEQAGANVGGLSRRRNDWYDEEEEDEEEEEF